MEHASGAAWAAPAISRAARVKHTRDCIGEVSVGDAGRQARLRARTTMVRKNGMPTSDVTMPTGINAPGRTVLDATEASDRIRAPASALPGR
ncbi:hypothetical protein G6F23_015390 [Rhizopus arrhizus]|nr:hypothetical protein G6F23_015390 [Rhizopus arrhizus]